jgi:hypothetical protein
MVWLVDSEGLGGRGHPDGTTWSHHKAFYFTTSRRVTPVPVAARSKESVCDLSLLGIAGSNPAGRHGCSSLVSVVT